MQNRNLLHGTWVAGAALCILSLTPGSAAAAETPIQAVLDGRELAFPISPVIENGRTLVPARRLLESLGAHVTWDEATRTVSATRADLTVRTAIDSTAAEVNGKAVTLEVAPRIAEGHTLIPLRFFVENLGLAVAWDGETRTIHIDSTRSAGAPSRGATVDRSQAALAVELAARQVGNSYAWGGISPATGFDCSGLMYYVGKQVGVELPRTSFEMMDVGEAIALDQLQAGDLVFFTTYAPGASHVGIYDGKGGFIHAQSSETGVKVTAMSNPWWAQRYLGARRIYR